MAGACSDDRATTASKPTPSRRPSVSAVGDSDKTDVHYMLVADSPWELREAVDYRAGLGALGKTDPDLDWYVEYDGPRVDHDGGFYTIPHVVVSGHTAGLDKRRDQLPGFKFRSDLVGGRRALIAAAAGGNPAVVVIDLASDHTVTLLTYDDGVKLPDLALRLTAANEQQWIAAGGTMLNCVPLTPGCTPHI